MTNPTAAKDGTERRKGERRKQDTGHCPDREISDDGYRLAPCGENHRTADRRVAPNPPAPTRVIHVGDNPPTAEQVRRALGKTPLHGRPLNDDGAIEFAPAPIGLDTPPQCPTCGSPNPDYCIGHCPDHFHDGRTPQMGYAAPAGEVREIPTPQGKGAEAPYSELLLAYHLAHENPGITVGTIADCPFCKRFLGGKGAESGGSQAIGESAVQEPAGKVIPAGVCSWCREPIARNGDSKAMPWMHVANRKYTSWLCDIPTPTPVATPASEPTGDATTCKFCGTTLQNWCPECVTATAKPSAATGDATPQVTAEEAREWLRSPEIFQMRWTNSLNNQLSCEDRECLLLVAFANRAVEHEWNRCDSCGGELIDGYLTVCRKCFVLPEDATP